jgi:ElaA protein
MLHRTQVFNFGLMEWNYKMWQELGRDELFDIYKLRVDVFVVEQDCAYPEIDDNDKLVGHLFAYADGQLTAYSRLCPPNTVYPEASMGRVICHPGFRGQGLGRELVKRAVEQMQKDFPEQNIKAQAQQYLEDFYKSFGFKTISEPYLEDGIAHVDMVL